MAKVTKNESKVPVFKAEKASSVSGACGKICLAKQSVGTIVQQLSDLLKAATETKAKGGVEAKFARGTITLY